MPEAEPGRCTRQKLQQPYPFMPASTERELPQFTREKRVDDDGIHVTLAAHRGRIAESAGDRLQHFLHFLIRFTRGSERLAGKRFEGLGSRVPRSEVLRGERVS